MKKHIALLAAAVIGALSGSPLIAQTNLSQPLNIDLMATYAGTNQTVDSVVTTTAKTVHLTTSNVIAALGTSLGTTFSNDSQLILTLTSSGITVTVKEGTNTAADVSGYFGFSASSNTVDSVSFRTNNSTLVTNVLGLETFTLQDVTGTTALPWHFVVSGISSESFAGIDSSGTVTEDGYSFAANVSGAGDYADEFAVYQGTISAGACGSGPGGPIQTGSRGNSPPTTGGGTNGKSGKH